MKTIFIVNPAAGWGKALEIINEATAKLECEFEIYCTKAPNDATEYIRSYCEKNPDKKVRFCACGGDGTLNEVVNGAAGFENAEVTCYPCGSGNDFVKYYGGSEVFSDANALVSVESAPIDLIKVGEKYSVNIVNFGFDTCVARTMNKVRNKPIIGGKNAYNYGVFKSVLTAMRNKAKIFADGELLNESGKFLLCTVANGKYVGGKFHCAPRSDNTDGLLEVCMIKPISIFKFLKILGPYEKGVYLDDPKFADWLVYRRCKEIKIQAPEGFAITLDGEIISGTEFALQCEKGALNFAVPK